MRRIKFFFFILPSILVSNVFGNTIDKGTLLVCYGKIKPSTIKGYNCVILESNHYKKEEIEIIKKNNKKVIAYISLGEVNPNAKYYNKIKDNILGENKNWGSYYLDMKSLKTQDVLMDEIKIIINKGFDGLFLDNIDNFSSFGPQANQKEFLIQFINKLNTAYPTIHLVQNSGAELVNDTATLIDAILFESIASDYSFKDKKYKLREVADYENYIKNINKIHNDYQIPIYLIEYADSSKLAYQISNRISKTNFDFFIGKLDLQSLPIYK